MGTIYRKSGSLRKPARSMRVIRGGLNVIVSVMGTGKPKSNKMGLG
jgi:hypothetical protein